MQARKSFSTWSGPQLNTSEVKPVPINCSEASLPRGVVRGPFPYASLSWHLFFRRLVDKGRSVLRGLGLYSRFLEEPQISKPVNESVLPSAEGHPISVSQPGAHPGAVAQ